VISCIWCLVEDRIRKKVSRYLALWIRESVAVVQPFSRVGVTFVPPCMEMFAIETLRNICVIFSPPCCVRTVSFAHIGFDEGS
jgi:hypothetical protein